MVQVNGNLEVLVQYLAGSRPGNKMKTFCGVFDNDGDLSVFGHSVGWKIHVQWPASCLGPLHC